MYQNITLLGSTGSIGRQTLDVVRKLGIKVCALTANNSIKLLEEQAREFKPRAVCIADENKYLELKNTKFILYIMVIISTFSRTMFLLIKKIFCLHIFL